MSFTGRPSSPPFVFPDLLREQRGLAIRRETSNQGHAVADLDRARNSAIKIARAVAPGGGQARTALIAATDHDLGFRIASANSSKI
jgi:hypothetical protein